MAAYKDTRQMIIDALMGREPGTQIQPEDHQAYALNMLDYIRSVELTSGSALIGFAGESITPIEPPDAKVMYVSGVNVGETVVFTNFIGSNNQPITITAENSGKFVVLLWNTVYWDYQVTDTVVVSGGGGGGFYNLDSEHPLPSSEEHYTLESAIETIVADEEIDDKDKNGMIITFFDGSEWKNYRYKEMYTSVSRFSNTENWEEFTAGGGGGGQDSGRIVLQRITPNLTTKVGSQVKLQFYFDHVDAEGQSTGNSGTATIQIVRGGVVTRTFNRTVTAGTSTIDVTDYCGVGITIVKVVVRVDTGLAQQSAAVTWSVSEVQLNLFSDLNGCLLVNQGENFQLSYTLESGSNDMKTVALYVDSVQKGTQTQSSATSSGTFNISTNDLSHGQHTIQLRAYQSTGMYDEHEEEVFLYSNLIYCVFGVLVSGSSVPITTMLIDIPDGDTVFESNESPSVNLNQYDAYLIKYL